MTEIEDAAMWVETAVGSWIGDRGTNEDRVYSDGTTIALFDGIGGRAFGETAAAIALAEVVRRTALDRLTGRTDVAGALKGADDAVRTIGSSLGVHIGTTAVIAYLEVRDDIPVAHLGWAGDSAAYLLRGEGIVSLTREGLQASEDRPDGLATWLGSGEHLAPRRVSHALQPGDTLILASDGVTNVLDASAIGWLAKSRANPQAAVDAILEAAAAAAAAQGSTDNCSVVVATLLGSDPPRPHTMTARLHPRSHRRLASRTEPLPEPAQPTHPANNLERTQHDSDG